MQAGKSLRFFAAPRVKDSTSYIYAFFCSR
jgi:hypothetical protein